MGLDITAYKRLHKVENPILDENGYPEDYDNEWLPGASMDWSERIWQGRGEGVNSKTVYTYEDRYEFRAGSYFGYSWWRNKLNSFKGDAAFQELIEFADNEGVIGNVVAKKLLNDFKLYEEEAKEYAKTLEHTWWLEGYYNWMKAFEYASDNGAVDFH